MSYAGDVSCKECWEALHENKNAQLVDVRTLPEWNFVGLPVLDEIGKRAITVEWQQFPDMAVNPDFANLVFRAVEAAGGDMSAHIYCLCRSGVRSIAAAQALTSSGFTNAYNVLGGFEGDKNASGHRAQLGGWKFEQLPWVQG